MQLGLFISLVPMSKTKKNALLLSLWSPGSTTGLSVWYMSFKPPDKLSKGKCLLFYFFFFYTEYLLCAMFTESLKLCIWPFFTTLVIVIWFWKRETLLLPHSSHFHPKGHTSPRHPPSSDPWPGQLAMHRSTLPWPALPINWGWNVSPSCERTHQVPWTVCIYVPNSIP